MKPRSIAAIVSIFCLISIIVMCAKYFHYFKVRIKASLIDQQMPRAVVERIFPEMNGGIGAQFTLGQEGKVSYYIDYCESSAKVVVRVPYYGYYAGSSSKGESVVNGPVEVHQKPCASD